MTDCFDLGCDVWGTYRETLEFDNDGKARVVFHGDNSYQIDANKAAQNNGTNGYGQSREVREIISLDPASYLLIATMHGVRPFSPEHDEVVLKLAQSNEWRDIRTVSGGVRNSMSAPRFV